MQRSSDRQKMLAAHGVPISDERLIEILDMRRLTAVEGRIPVHGQDEQSRQNYSKEQTPRCTSSTTHQKWTRLAAEVGCGRIILYGYGNSFWLAGQVWTFAISEMQKSC